MMNKKHLLLLLFVSLAGIALAQGDDHGIWFGASVKHDITKKLDVELFGSVRTFKNVTKVDQSLMEGSAGYSFNKYLSVAGSYRFIYSLEDDDQFHYRHRVSLDVKGNLPAGRFSFSARARFQRTELTYIEEFGDATAKYYGRLRFKAAWDIPSFPLTPYVYYEPFVPMFTGAQFEIDRNRFAAGATLKISAKSSVETEFIFQRDFNKKSISDIQILSINYSLKF
jgi:hypothetical protein